VFVPAEAVGAAGVPVSVGDADITAEPVPVMLLKPTYSASHDNASVPEARIEVILMLVPDNTVLIKFPPEELTVKLPVLLFSITYRVPTVIVLAAGITTV
jgi:hypothetical protein